LEISQLKATDGADLQLYHCSPEGEPCGLIYLAHGMGEHARRYEGVMQILAAAGFLSHRMIIEVTANTVQSLAILALMAGHGCWRTPARSLRIGKPFTQIAR
jgi:hypothetical protein